MSISILNRGASGGLKPELTVTAPSGSTIDLLKNGIIVATYTLSASETEHTFVVKVGTYTVRGTLKGYTRTISVVIDTVGQYAVKCPVGSISLSKYSEGSVVYIPENGTNTAFYVVEHNYQSGLNGNGRTLLMRVNLYESSQYYSTNTSGASNFAKSIICSKLNSTYLELFNSTVQEAIGTTTFYYLPTYNSSTTSTLTKAVFIPAAVETGATLSDCKNTDGKKFPVADSIRIAEYNGEPSHYWLRTPDTRNSYALKGINADGTLTSTGAASTSWRMRPIFTLPAETLFDAETNEIVV